MSGLRQQSACIALMLAAMAPLLAGCNEPTAATAAPQVSEPEVSVIAVKPQPRAVLRELPGRIAPTRVSKFARTRIGYRRRAHVPSGERGQGRRSALRIDRPLKWRCNRPKRHWPRKAVEEASLRVAHRSADIQRAARTEREGHSRAEAGRGRRRGTQGRATSPVRDSISITPPPFARRSTASSAPR